MDSGSLTSEHEADSGVGSMNSFEPPICVSITVPDLSIQKSLQFNPEESVWAAKQQILLSVAKGLKEGFNYGLFIPPTNGKAGKFLDDGRLLKEYSLTAAFSSLELIMKRRIYKHVMATEKKLKQLHSKSSLKQVMEWVRKGDVDKVIKVTNQGLDPNFIDPDSGETPVSLSVSLEHPTRMILSLVGGGAHLDYRNSKGLTPLHLAAIQSKEEAIKGLLDLGASANYYDLQGLTPAYHCVCNNSSSPKCLEMLLYDHAILGSVDESNWTELHQACKWGRVQHLELMIYYGANLNAQNTGGSTPLHICAVSNQEDCARVILFRGADKTIKNFANHDASETATISGNSVLAQIIRDFSDDDVVPYQDAPRYNEKRRARLQTGTLSGTPMQRWRSNPQLHMLFHDDQLSTRTANIRNNYDLTLPRDMSLGGKPIRRQSDIPLVSEVFGVKLNQPHFPRTSKSGFLLPRMVFLKPGKNGYGFILRGSRGSADDSNFVPTPEVPALQYFSIIAENSMAELAGIRPRDFLLEVNGQNVRRASHDYTVNLIKQSKDNLSLLVVSPAEELKAPVVRALNTMESPWHSTRYNPTLNSHFAPQFNKTNGGLADLENLERMIDEDDCGEIDSGTSLKRLFIAPNVQMLERMARAAGAGGNVASVHTRHGKQMAKSMPLGETYQDSIGLCRSRVASLPNEDPRVGNLWRANSMQNLVLPEATISEAEREVKILQKPRVFIPKDRAPPPCARMFSLPGSEPENGKPLQGAVDNISYQEKQPVLKRINTTDGTVAPQPPLSAPPPLPMKTSRLNLGSSRDSTTKTTASAEHVGVIELNANKVSKNEPSSPLPPPLPPLRPAGAPRPVNSAAPLKTSKIHQTSPVFNSNNVLQNDEKFEQFHHPAVSVAPSLSNSAVQSASKTPHLTAAGAPRPTLPPPPPPPPPVDSFPPCSMKSSSTTQQSTLKEESSGRRPVAAQNCLLEEIKKKRELLAPRDTGSLPWEEEGSRISNNGCGQQFHKLPSQTLAVASTPSSDTSLLSEIQKRRKQMELKAAAENHVQEVAENQMETGETSSNDSQQPFLQDLLKALSHRTKPSNETTTIPSTANNRAPALPAAGKLNEENIPVQNVNLQPVHNRYQHSPSVFPTQLNHPPAPPKKFNSPVPPRIIESFPGVGKTHMSFQRNKSVESLDFDLPPPPPPPAPTFDDLGVTDLDDLLLPLPPPPPPEEFDLPSSDSFLQVLKSSPVPLSDCNTRQGMSASNVRNGMVGTKGKEEVSCQSLDMWSITDVALWLKSIELGEHANAFVENSVDGVKLSQLNFIDWIQLGISDLDQRMKIVQARQKLVT